jgi:AraC family transcriptional regulator, glycine betaine-responsive activator
MWQHDPRISFLTEFIEANLADTRLSIKEVASQVQLSQSRVRQLMQLHMHTSPKQYIRQRRLQRARELLHTSFLSVKEVMARVGFSDASHFSRDYKGHFKVVPRMDRLPIRKNGD